MAEYLPVLVGICLFSIIFFWVADAVGAFLSACFQSQAQVGNLLLGTTVLVSIAALLTTNGVTIFLFPLGLLTYFLVRKRSVIPTLNYSRLLTLNWIFPVLICLNVCIRFLMLFNSKSGSLFTDYVDQYNYIDQVNLTLKYGMETDFLGLENLVFGEHASHSVYHYFEVYISVLGKFFTRLPTYYVFEFFTLPILLSFAQIQLVRLSSAFYQTRLVSGTLIVLAATSCFRFFCFEQLLLWPLRWTDWFVHLAYFPLYTITSEHSLYFYSYIFKISTFVILFSVYHYSVVRKDSILLIVSSVLAVFVNLVFLPFFVVINMLHTLAQKKRTRVIFYLFGSLLFLAVFYFLVNRNSPSAPSASGGLPVFKISFGVTSLYRYVLGILNFSFGNYYPSILLVAALLFVKLRSFRSGALLILVLLFPFTFFGYSIFFKVFLVGVVGILLISVKPITEALRHNPVPGFSVTAILSLAFINSFLYPFFDFYQVCFVPLFALLAFFPALYLSRFELNKFGCLVVILFIVNNIWVLYFQSHRISLPGNPKPFVSAFLNKTGGRFTKGVYVSSIPYRPYFYIGRTGYDIQNQSDSLALTFISFDQLNRKDTNSLLLTRAWPFYQKFPFVRFYNRHRNSLLLDDSKRLFLKEKGITCIFRSKGDPRILVDFANGYLSDSLYNPKEMSWVYFLSREKLNAWKPANQK